MKTSLNLAIPSKGRMKEQTESWLGGGGMSLRSGAQRSYATTLEGLEGLNVQLFPAREISRGIVSGGLRLGITGEDILREDAGGNLKGRAHLLMPLGFGEARLVVAVPQGWPDVESMEDLAEIADELLIRTGIPMRVATKYARLTYSFFERHHVTCWRMVASAGATEGTPAAGLADIIVDITTTGRTLADNGLKVLADGEILFSQAHLSASLSSSWESPELEVLQTLLERLSGQKAAQNMQSGFLKALKHSHRSS